MKHLLLFAVIMTLNIGITSLYFEYCVSRANALIIEATAEAEAMKLKQQQLNTTYVDYIRAQRWNGVLPTTSLGSGTGALINLKQ